MYRYVARRLLILIPTLLAIIFIVFFIMDLTPSDPGTLILGERASKESIDKMNEDLGYYDPFFTRYFTYVFNALKGDLGVSWKSGRPVISEITNRLPVTLTLAAGSVIIGMIFGVILGIVSAVKQYGALDYFGTFLAMALASFPAFWIGMVLIVIFSLYLKILPSFGAGSLSHYILPWITTAAVFVASQLRMTRASMLEALRMDYVRTARAKGQTERKVITKHALRNALLPIVTILGINFGTLLGGTVTVEAVFSLPGTGSLIIEAIRMKDIPIVLGATVFLSAGFTIVMLLVDILYASIDPRIKSRYARN